MNKEEIENYKIISMVEPNMTDEKIKKALKIEQAILTGECDKCKYLNQCEKGVEITSEYAWCNKESD